MEKVKVLEQLKEKSICPEVEDWLKGFSNLLDEIIRTKTDIISSQSAGVEPIGDNYYYNHYEINFKKNRLPIVTSEDGFVKRNWNEEEKENIGEISPKGKYWVDEISYILEKAKELKKDGIASFSFETAVSGDDYYYDCFKIIFKKGKILGYKEDIGLSILESSVSGVK